jgi:hypothetical protein
VAELAQQGRLANLAVPADGGDGDGGDGKAAKSKKRKKGAAAAAADEAFYVDDDTPIERMPKKNVKVGVGLQVVQLKFSSWVFCWWAATGGSGRAQLRTTSSCTVH